MIYILLTNMPTKANKLKNIKKQFENEHHEQKAVKKAKKVRYEEEEENEEVDEDMTDVNEEELNDDEMEAEEEPVRKVMPKNKQKELQRLKEKVLIWLNNDDKIKEYNKKVKVFKDKKKEHEEKILEMIDALGINEDKMDIDNRGRVYKSKSVTKGALKEDMIKNALLEVIKSEKQVDQLVKKIESKRPVVERYYLKRTKGDGKD